MAAINPIAEVERDPSQADAAPYVNRFFITVGPVVRIAFAEQWGPSGRLIPRTAVALAHADAIALKNVLGALLGGIEKDLERFQAESQPKDNAGG